MNYEERLEVAKRLYELSNTEQKTALECIFSELCESEDEKIRKWLIGYFHQYKEDGMEKYANGLKVESILAWLEKQCNPTDEDMKEVLRTEYEKGRADAIAQMQKEWSGEYEEYNGADYGIDSLYHAQRILEKTLGSVDGYQTDDGILSHKCAITAVKKLYEQKPAEWSEDDYAMIEAAINLAHEYGRHGLWVWLRTLKERVQPQPKQAWSEEDERIYKVVLELLNSWSNGTISGCLIPPNTGRYINWFKDIKDRVQLKTAWGEKDEFELECILSHLRNFVHEDVCLHYENWLKSLRPQNRWKPSDEQMRALDSTAGIVGILTPTGVTLCSLYHDLEKLKGE